MRLKSLLFTSFFVLLTIDTTLAGDYGSLNLSTNQEAILREESLYRDHLLNSLGCCLRASFEKQFETDHYKHVGKRISQLNKLRKLVEASSWRDEVGTYIKAMGEFKSERGRVLRSVCLSSTKDTHECDDIFTCLSCLDQPRVVLALPCKHLLYCLDCRDDYQERQGGLLGGCSVCRETVDKYVVVSEVLSTCIRCEQKTADTLFPACNHLVSCSDCAVKNTAKACPLCQKVSAKIFHIFR